MLIKKELALLSYIIIAAGCMIGCHHSNGFSENYTDNTIYVDPMIGTGFHGHTFPGATRPFAMVQLSPDTHIMGWDASSGYHADDREIYAFSHTHLSGTGIGDLGDIALLPYSGEINPLKPVATFKKENEKAEPGYYAVHLDNFGIDVELTSTDRVGFHKYTFSQINDRNVCLNLGHILQPNWGHRLIHNDYTQIDEKSVCGTFITQGWAHRQTISYMISFSEPIEQIKEYIAGELTDNTAMGNTVSTDQAVQLHYHFPKSDQPLYVKVALSPVSTANANQNMTAELSGWDFEQIKKDAHKEWCKTLSSIQIETKDTTLLTNFYTALYHSHIAPNLYQDINGEYIGMDKQRQKAEGDYVNYSIFSLWDTFRAFHPLMTIIQPDLATNWGKVLVQGYREGTILPKWPLAANYTGCMVGYPAVSVLADLVCKEMNDQGLKLWTEAGVRSSIYREDLAKRFAGTRELDLITRHLYYKDNYHFIPADSIPESVSWGVETAYYDWCISQIASKAGETDIAERYAQQAKFYQYYLDPETKMMRPVMADGSFKTPFNPRYSAHQKSDYTEGNAFQWSFFVPHDMDNFITAIGGKKELETRLDTLFHTSSQIDGEEASGDITGLIGQYAHGNEPSHHMAYLYNWTDAPWKAQEQLDYIMRNFYTTAPDGIIGNEDCGQMSAWFVMSALGIYQVCPGLPVYTFGRPMIDKATIHVQNGEFVIIVHNNSSDNKFIQEIKLNGETISDMFISHEQIVQGGTLEIWMSANHPY